MIKDPKKDDDGGVFGEWEAPSEAKGKRHIKSNWYYYVVAAVILVVLIRSCS